MTQKTSRARRGATHSSVANFHSCFALKLNLPLLKPSTSHESFNSQFPTLALHIFYSRKERTIAFKALMNGKIRILMVRDLGASISFIDKTFVRKIKLIPHPKNCLEVVHEVDG